MPTALVTTQHPALTSARQALPPAIQSRLLDLEVESTYNRPDVCLLTFDIDANTEIPPQLELGKPLEVGFRGDRATTKIFEGEITALEYDSMDNRTVFIVQAEDKFHRLFRGDRTRTWTDMTASDAVKTVGSQSGVPVGHIESTRSKLPFQMQQNVSDGVWLLERAREHGFHARVKEGKLFWGKVGAGGDSGVTLEHNTHLLGFNCRVTANAYVEEVTVRSWDTTQKKLIEGTAKAYGGTKDDKVAGALDKPKVFLTRTDLGSVEELTAAAQAAIDRSNEHNLQAEGRCYGDVRLAVDKLVTIKGVNKRFNLAYRISHLRHRYSEDQGYTTEFSCRGVSDQSLTGLVTESTSSAGLAPDNSVFDGVTVGVVTDIKDPEDLGRVKVELPSLPGKSGTGIDWMRMAFAGGGGNGGHHGWYLLPDVGDEVLVAFEQGDARRGYVLGGLLNGQHKPGYKLADVVKKPGVVNQHAFRLKSGAHLLFDEAEGKEVIELKSKGTNFVFKFDETKGVELKNTVNDKTITISNTGAIAIIGESGDISIEAKAGKLSLKAVEDVTIESVGGKVAIKAAQQASLEGLNASLKGKASAEVTGATTKLEATGPTIVKGAIVNIN